MIPVEDKHLLEKLGCDNLIDLALLVPHSFDDTTLYSQAIPGQKQAIEVTVRSRQHTGSNLRIELFSHNLNIPLHAMIFHAKPYHFATFVPHKKMYLFGKLEQSSWGASIAQPVKISKVGAIIANYGSKIRNDTHNRLIQSYLTIENLQNEGLPLDIATTLVGIHFMQSHRLKSFNNEGVNSNELLALKFAECYTFMKKLSYKKQNFPSISQKACDPKPWIATLPFVLTQDQMKAIDAIYLDLQKTTASKRMVVGDVGSGKTMVILATVFMNCKGKSILMAPTTLLAIQLFEEAQKFLPAIKSVLITNKTHKKVNLQEYDFIIGTHALLFRELPTANVVMIDEQHRFGTKQRNMIEKMVQIDDKRAHFLQFSATPIPRTQAMINSALLEVSLIEQMPFEKDITTSLIGKQDFPALIERIKDEIAHKRQVLIVYPLVEESEAVNYQSLDEARSYWESHFEKVYLTHGKDKDKDEVLLRFREEGNILLATTVVEVGISLPRLSTIVIVGAERLGFATLHQLRGRVSRTGLKGYCYLFSHFGGSKRLEEFAKVKNGFDIAALDLKYRQSGDLLSGKRQSGSKFMWFDESEDEVIAGKVKELLLAQKG